MEEEKIRNELINSFSNLTKEQLILKLTDLSIEFNEFNKSSKEIEDLLESENENLQNLNNQLTNELNLKNQEIKELNEIQYKKLTNLEIENDLLSNELKSSNDKYIELFDKFEFLQLDLTNLLNINNNLTTQNEKLNNSLNKFKFYLNQTTVGIFNRDKLKISKFTTPPIDS